MLLPADSLIQITGADPFGLIRCHVRTYVSSIFPFCHNTRWFNSCWELLLLSVWIISTKYLTISLPDSFQPYIKNVNTQPPSAHFRSNLSSALTRASGLDLSPSTSSSQPIKRGEDTAPNHYSSPACRTHTVRMKPNFAPRGRCRCGPSHRGRSATSLQQN